MLKDLHMNAHIQPNFTYAEDINILRDNKNKKSLHAISV